MKISINPLEVLNQMELKEILEYCKMERDSDFIEKPSDPMTYLKLFKEDVAGNGYTTKEELKELICNYIDIHMTKALY